ncbi:MAG: SDR family oxidoreductase [Pseudomonadota bacterium]
MILLTGASGVVGRELTPRLPQDRLILARHRARPGGTARQVAIDIRQATLGLSDTDYAALCGEVDTIVHCAAITDMSGDVPELSATNISGVRNIIAFAEAAGARLHFVSTAYCSETYGPAAPVASEYVASKRDAEALVRNSSVPWTISRPSIISGHSQTGEIASFQGFHLFIATVLNGRLPIIPLERDTQCDFIPADWVAAGIADVVANPDWGQTHWLTSGANALTIGEMMDCGRAFAAEMGRDLNQVSWMSPQQVEAEILPALRPRQRERLRILVDLSKVMARAAPFPTHVKAVTKKGLRETLLANLRYWKSQSGRRGSA